MLAQVPALRAVATETPHTTNSGIKTKLEKAKFNLSKLKDKIESSLLESENGSWPSCDEHFKNAVDLITTCYGELQDSSQSPNPICIAVLEDYLCALLETDIHMLARETQAIKRLTNKALREINTTKKTVVPDEQVQFSVTEIAVKKTLLYIKNQFLPAKPILPPQESLVEKIKKKGLAAYTYISQTIEEHPTITGVAGFVVIAGSLYWISTKFSSESGGHGGGKPPKDPPVTLNANVDPKEIAAARQQDGKSCGYHSAENGLHVAKELLTQYLINKNKLPSPDEIKQFMERTTWPSKEQIQDVDKTLFTTILAEDIKALAEKLKHLPSNTEEEQALKKDLQIRHDGMVQALNGTGWIDGDTITRFIDFLLINHATGKLKTLKFADDIEDLPFYWNVIEAGKHLGVPGQYERSLEVLESAKKVCHFLSLQEPREEGIQALQKIIRKFRSSSFPKEPSKEIIAEDAAGKKLLSLADLTDVKDLPDPTKIPTIFKILRAFYAGKTIILSWRDAGHWTCGVAHLLEASSPPKIRGYTIDSSGPHMPSTFKQFLNVLATTKPIPQGDIDAIEEIFAE